MTAMTRNGLLTTNHLVHLQEYLEAQYPSVWRTDITAAYMAATYGLLRKQDANGNFCAAEYAGDLLHSSPGLMPNIPLPTFPS